MKKHIKKHFSSTIRSRLLFVFLGSVLIPLILFGILSFLFSANELEQETYGTYKQMTNQISALFSEYISRTDQTLRAVDNSQAVPMFLRNGMIITIGETPDIQFLKDNAFASLKQLGNTNSSLFSLTACTMEGDTVSYVNRDRDTMLLDLSNPYYEALKDSTGNTVVLPIRDSSFQNTPSQKVFTIAYKHLDSMDDGSAMSSYTGYIIAECPISKFEEFCSFASLDSDINVYILDQSGELAYSTDPDDHRCADILSLFDTDQKNSYIHVDGEDYMLVGSPLSDTGWMGYTTIPKTVILNRSMQIMHIFFLLCIASMLIIILATYAVSGYFTKPVILLQKAMKKVSGGDLTIRVPENRSDEFGDLNKGFNHLMNQMDILIRNTAEAQERENAAKYQMLQSQINPHFLYNTLDSIRMMAVLADQDMIAEALLHLSALFRYHVRNSTRLVSVEEELTQVKNYLYLQKLRFQSSLEIEYDVADEVLPYKMPRLLLQPILENSLSHGFTDTDHTYVIQIQILRKEDYIAFTIRDNGCGMSQETLDLLRQRLASRHMDKQQGIGLSNVNERLHLYFSDDCGLMIESREQEGTSVFFRIPVLADDSTLFKYDKFVDTNRKDGTSNE